MTAELIPYCLAIVQNFLRDACNEAKIIVTDHNAPMVNKMIVIIPAALSPWQCTIIRDTATYNAIATDLYSVVVRVAEGLQEICQANDAVSRLVLKRLANVARRVLWDVAKDKAALPFDIEEVRAEARTLIIVSFPLVSVQFPQG